MARVRIGHLLLLKARLLSCISSSLSIKGVVDKEWLIIGIDSGSSMTPCSSADSFVHIFGMDSVNHNLINPLGLYVVYASIWDLPATFLYCCPVTVLEWNSGHVIILPPVAKVGSLVSHRSRSSALMRS